MESLGGDTLKKDKGASVELEVEGTDAALASWNQVSNQDGSLEKVKLTSGDGQ